MEVGWKGLVRKGKGGKLEMGCVIGREEGVGDMGEVFGGDDVRLWCGGIEGVLEEEK